MLRVVVVSRVVAAAKIYLAWKRIFFLFVLRTAIAVEMAQTLHTHGGDKVAAHSAPSRPSGKVNAKAIANWVMI